MSDCMTYLNILTAGATAPAVRRIVPAVSNIWPTVKLLQIGSIMLVIRKFVSLTPPPPTQQVFFLLAFFINHYSTALNAKRLTPLRAVY